MNVSQEKAAQSLSPPPCPQPPPPSSCSSVFHWYSVPLHLSAPAHIHVAFKLTTSGSVFILFFFLAALRNLLFSIYFIANIHFLIYFFPYLFTPPPHFFFFFPLWGLLLKVTLFFDVYFRFKLEQIFSLGFLGGGEGGLSVLGGRVNMIEWLILITVGVQ